MILAKVVQRPETRHIQIKIETAKPIDGDDTKAICSLNLTRITVIDRDEGWEMSLYQQFPDLLTRHSGPTIRP